MREGYSVIQEDKPYGLCVGYNPDSHLPFAIWHNYADWTIYCNNIETAAMNLQKKRKEV